uniref:Uncharacterized protein n=1 Tax=Mimivirus LCMiAC02 TaxID=2506609 RepID=A0A4D5XFN5_9VIRU|nr:MAG: hypothetical protein LCMiAC02_03160 [Mimivirus LCMiAC02]
MAIKMSTFIFAPKKKNPTIKMDDTEKNRKWKNDLQERFQDNMDEAINNISEVELPNSSQLRAPKKKNLLMNYSTDELLKLGEIIREDLKQILIMQNKEE